MDYWPLVFFGGMAALWVAQICGQRLGPQMFDASFVASMTTRISCQLDRLQREVLRMSAELKALTDKVAQTVSTMDSAATLIEGLAQQIRDNATDPVALQKLADDLDAERGQLAAAVESNTPTV